MESSPTNGALGTTPIFNAAPWRAGRDSIPAGTYPAGSPFFSLNGTTPGPCSTAAYDRNLRVPYVETWNMDIQHSFTNNLSLDIAYLGNHGVKILGTRDINAPAVGAGYSAGGLAELRSRTPQPAVPDLPRSRTLYREVPIHLLHRLSYRTRIGLTTTPCSSA